MDRNRFIPKMVKRGRRKVGLSPGTMEYIGVERAERVKISIIDYSETHFEEKEVREIEECFPYRDKTTVSWINIDGIHNTQILGKLGNHFGVHPLVLEDIVNTQQRPKLEDYQNYLYIVLKMLHGDVGPSGVTAEQISLLLGGNFVISFQEKEGDLFDSVRERIRKGKGRARKMGADYLAYALIDAIVDNYFVILENLGERIESLEEGLMVDATPRLLQKIHHLKRETILIRRSVWPLREVVSGLERGESRLVRKPTHVFLRDVYDHTIQVIDAVESHRDMLSGMQDLYLSSISNKMNEVMKVLTIIATIFVPLTFVAGIYGMNFEFMPELKWRWSYLIFWIAIAVLAGLMLSFFRRKKWL